VIDIWSANYDSTVEPWIYNFYLGRADVWFCTAFSFLALAGLILAICANWQGSLPLALCLFLFPIPYYLTRSSLRFRHPIDPFLAIFTVYAIARFLAILRGRAGRQPSNLHP
jgi:hypothetical protein